MHNRRSYRSASRSRVALAKQRERSRDMRAKARAKAQNNKRNQQRIGWVPSVPPPSRWAKLFQPFWVLPLVICLMAIFLGVLLPKIPNSWLLAWPLPVLFDGDADTAKSILTTVSSAMISVTTLVFSMTVVVLQLASSQFTPRILATFLESRITQATLGVFTGTFLYSLTVLRAIRGETLTDSAFVPEIAVAVSFLGVILSVAFFLGFIRHITMQIQVSNVIERTVDKALIVLDRVVPKELPKENNGIREWNYRESAAVTDFYAPSFGGAMTYVDYEALVEIASAEDLMIEVTVQVGEYCPGGLAIGKVWSRNPATEKLLTKINSTVQFDINRALRQDLLFAVRQLVDIAERALSPGFNDPTTAVQVIDGLHQLFRCAVQRKTPTGLIMGADGIIRLSYRPQTVVQALDLAVPEIYHWGKDSFTIPKRLESMMADLARIALPEYQASIKKLQSLVSRRLNQAAV